jgi:aminoglycoside 2'-N-acetyltransferase I
MSKTRRSRELRRRHVAQRVAVDPAQRSIGVELCPLGFRHVRQGVGVTEPLVVRTHELANDRLARVRALLLDAFGGEFTDDDWAHTLGGWHVLVGEEAHAAVVERTIEIGGRALRAGYVEGVATAPTLQGRGLGSSVMRRVGELLRDRFDLGVLSTGSHGFYERLGWNRWQGPSYVRHGDRVVRTADEDAGIMVLRYGTTARLDLTQTITCETRPGDDW